MLIPGLSFSNAKVRIDGEIWAGNVEIHVRASDWRRLAMILTVRMIRWCCTLWVWMMPR